ncbi:MAG: hypothetical protein L6R28_02525 [Planctomycetes bacterium]|nr:hypothetical protein [Planctomycetota bacterium]
MNRRVAFLAAAVCAAATLPAHLARAEETPAQPKPVAAPLKAEDITQWVKALSSEQHDERARASKALEDLGAEALPALRAAAAGEDEVVKDEASKIIERLDRKSWLERLKNSEAVMGALKKLCAKKLDYKPGWTPPYDGFKTELKQLEDALKTVAMPFPRKFKLVHGTFCLLGHFGAAGGQMAFLSIWTDRSHVPAKIGWGEDQKYHIGMLRAQEMDDLVPRDATAAPKFVLAENELDVMTAPPGESGTPVASLPLFDDLAPLLAESKHGEGAKPDATEQPVATPVATPAGNEGGRRGGR